jgi:hypothetical protein
MSSGYEQGGGSLPTPQAFGNAPDSDVSDLLTAQDYLVFPYGRYKVSGDATVPRSATVHFMGGSLEIDSGRTLTIKGQIIAPAKQIFYGEGSVEGPAYATEVMPEWFGAVGNGYEVDAANDTEAVRKAFNFAQGGVLKLSGMYSLDPERLELDGLSDGLHVKGDSGGATKDQRNRREGEPVLSNPTGFCLREDGEWMIRFGTREGRGRTTVNDTTWDDVVFDGMGREVHFALLWFYGFRTSKMRGGAIKSCRGPGCFAHKAEDVTWSGMQFVYLGVPEHQNKYGLAGAFLLGAPAEHSRFGNNVLFFNGHCRFEWFDGGLFRAVKEPVDRADYKYNDKSTPSITHFHFLGNKIEVGKSQGWGETRNDYFIFEFGALDDRRSLDDPRENHPGDQILISNNELATVNHAKGLIDLGKSDGIQISNNLLGFSPWGSNPCLLFNLRRGAASFAFFGNTASERLDAKVYYESDSEYRIHYEPPLMVEKV